MRAGDLADQVRRCVPRPAPKSSVFTNFFPFGCRIEPKMITGNRISINLTRPFYIVPPLLDSEPIHRIDPLATGQNPE